MKHLLLVYVSQNNCFYYLSNTNTPNTVLYYLLFQIVSAMLFVFPNSPLVAKKHYLYLNSQIVKYQIAALHGSRGTCHQAKPMAFATKHLSCHLPCKRRHSATRHAIDSLVPMQNVSPNGCVSHARAHDGHYG